MKKLRLITMLSAFTLAAAGAFGLANLKEGKKVESVRAATNSVTLAGDFNSWSASANPLTLNGDYWTIEREFAVGEEFKIVVNGSDWVGDGDGVSWCDGMGSNGKGQNFKVLTAGSYVIKAAKTIGDYGDKSYGIQFRRPADRYIVGEFGSCDWSYSGSVRMTHANNQYEAQVEFAFGEKFKVAYFDETSFGSYYGYSDILSTCGAYHYFSHDNDDNIQVYARGTYNIYFTDSNYGSEGGREKKITLELVGSKNAEHLAAELMGADISTGTCADRFPAMKTTFLGLSASEKTTFQGYASSGTAQFKNAYDRYVAWADALGEKRWESGKVSGSPLVSLVSNESRDTIVILIIVSMISVSAIGGFFFIKKRKSI